MVEQIARNFLSLQMDIEENLKNILEHYDEIKKLDFSDYGFAFLSGAIEGFIVSEIGKNKIKLDEKIFEEILGECTVPYDQVRNVGVGGAKYHRVYTLGHELSPVGMISGISDILINKMTYSERKINTSLKLKHLEIKEISCYLLSIKVKHRPSEKFNKIYDEKYNGDINEKTIISAVLRQLKHYISDIGTRESLNIPIVNLVTHFNISEEIKKDYIKILDILGLNVRNIVIDASALGTRMLMNYVYTQIKYSELSEKDKKVKLDRMNLISCVIANTNNAISLAKFISKKQLKKNNFNLVQFFNLIYLTYCNVFMFGDYLNEGLDILALERKLKEKNKFVREAHEINSIIITKNLEVFSQEEL